MLQQAFLESTHLVTSQTESASQEFNIPADGSQVRELPHQQQGSCEQGFWESKKNTA